MKLKKVKKWIRDGTPWIWFNAGAVTISIVMVAGLLLILMVRGLSHFWPHDVMRAIYSPPSSGAIDQVMEIIGEFVERESVSAIELTTSGIPVSEEQELYDRELFKFGNRDLTGADFGWILNEFVTEISYPESLFVLERRQWGNFYGYLTAIKQAGEIVVETDPGETGNNQAWLELELRLNRALEIYDSISQMERGSIGEINFQVERLRLRERRLELEDSLTAEAQSTIEAEAQALDAQYAAIQGDLNSLYEDFERDSAEFLAANGQTAEIPLAEIVRAYRPNSMNVFNKLLVYGSKLVEFLSDEPREANTEGGVYPAIFGTVILVLLMSVMVTPFGVVAAVYLREYAQQGLVTRTIRIAVNNLAGVPSIVYGVFGLGFFIYIVGGEIDQLFFPEALPAPTFGTPGLLWAALTLAILTVPVVIVATEEGLARIPRSVREGSLALGATKFETTWRVVLPMASPAMMTGLILAIARAAGEVAPLMLVGVVKLAPTLPVDGNYPFIHLDQKFMHLGFHIYDVGFQSPNVEAARPLVFATALLLVLLIALLNICAAALRNRLQEKYKGLDV